MGGPPASRAGHFAINGGALNSGDVRICGMFRCPQKTLNPSRLMPGLIPDSLSVRSIAREVAAWRTTARAAACAVALLASASVPALAQEAASGVVSGVDAAGKGAQGVRPASSAAVPLAASGAQDTSGAPNDFGARQKVLDRRTAENNYEYGVAQHNCYDTFFVNHCLGKARDKMRVVQADIRREQLALDEEQRADNARRRDEQAALQRARDQADAPQRAANEAKSAQSFEDKQRQHELDQAQRQAEAPQRAANTQAFENKQRQHALDQAQRAGAQAQSQRDANQAAYDRKQSNYQQQLDQARREGQQKAQERDQKAERFEQKQQDAAKHAADVQERQKQAAEKAQQKQQQEQQQQEQQLKQQQDLLKQQKQQNQ
ncbi:colicin transporter [Paraburkholderia sp. J69-1]|uniref:colicin transporter n=2 Tax=unclassified Paraburkholderia TaxID=2615204 RepID=UPI002AB6BB02|nr:colicin transporter [Paraburkholderia sp. J69-1]